MPGKPVLWEIPLKREWIVYTGLLIGIPYGIPVVEKTGKKLVSVHYYGAVGYAKVLKEVRAAVKAHNEPIKQTWKGPHHETSDRRRYDPDHPAELGAAAY